ncbi:MAG TPA: flagellar basal-body MS-ring/collar protein FliF [Steroidobacteraceae bacterium]|jgi:flagellar M-ring protein FliF|nr:flagellar basal-body MS-ring/collar protein FliF [Steroidobacteraceae bacterium]
MADIVPTSVPARGLADIPGLRQVGLLAGVAAAIAAAIWLVMWSQGQNYSVLYGQLSERESGQVMDALTAAGIEFKLSASGAVSVPESKVQEARIRLASQGLPQSDSMGIEMLQKESALGDSTMMESARYQSVLETELARTIVKVQGVQSARVHLALPKPSVFLRDAHKATASVMLQLYPGRRLDPGQVAAVVHLVASSVPELSANDVTVVDQAGTLLNSPDDNADAAATARQFEQTRKLEESYQQRIVDLLEPLVGAGRVRATVTADMDYTVTEETHENYDPQKTAVRSEQTSNEMRKGGDGAEGIPGALSNQPPGTSGAPVIPGAATPVNPVTPPNAAAPNAAAPNAAAAQANAAGSGPSSSSQRSTRNFEVDRTLSYVKQPVGTLKRLNVGVVLDDWQKVDADGKTTTAPMSDTDIKRFTQLVKESIGLKDDRGDQINVMNQAFKGNAALPPVEGLPLWQQPWLAQLAKQIVGAALVLIVAFLVLRPLMKSLTKTSGRSRAGAGEDIEGDRLSLSGQGKAIKLSPSFEQQIAAARTLVGQDPRRAAQVVKDWVSADG